MKRTLRTIGSRWFAAAATALLTIVAAAVAGAAPIYTENFSYTAPSSLNGQGGWSAHSGAGTNPQTVTAGSLTYAGYPGSGVGNGLGPIATSGEDDNHTFTGQSSGAVYAAALINVSSVQATGDYFLHFFDGAILGNTFRTRLFAKGTGSTFSLGIQHGSTVTTTYTPAIYSTGTTYLVVIKYTFNAGANNDQASLFVNPAITGTEPAPTVTHVDATQADAVNLDGIAIRQGGGAQAPSVRIDGIRVATNWGDAVGAHNITASSGPGGTISPSGVVSVPDGGSQTFTISPSDKCHVIADVLVDGVSQGAISSYTFTDVQTNHTISASFSTLGPFAITASAGPGGTISPSGTNNVPCGGGVTYTIMPSDNCHVIQDVVVDGVSQGPISTYSFNDVQAPHTISASFSTLGPFTITASAGPNGSIAPSGAVSVNCGANQAFSISANSGYHIDDVLVDGVSQGPIGSYSFNNVQANHTISASFAPDAAVIAAQSSSSVICPSNCVTLPVTISRNSNEAVLGFSVTIQLSANLALCSGNTGSITEGTFLSSAGATTFQVVDNGGGSYTVDGAVLGNDCGPTATSGTLFNVAVTSSAPSGTGSITVTSVKLRDCNNVDLPAVPGTPGTVTIDNTAPTVTVISPNGGEVYLIGSSQKISWNASDNAGVANVDIAYSTDGGATFPNVIATAIPNSGTYTWTVPNTPTTTARVRVTAHDTGCSSGFDDSDANFTIRDPQIVASAGPHGSISPSGTVSVPYGTDQTFTISADPCYAIQDVIVDGSSVGPVSSYTFTNVTTDHTISATFTPNLSPTTTTLSATPTSGKDGSVVSMTAVVAPSGATGTVEFFDGATSLGTSPVVSDTARFSTKLGQGSHSLTAVYGGDACHSTSTSNKVDVLFGAAPSLSITDTTKTEGETGTVNMTFRVRLSSTINNTVTVNYHTVDGTAVAGVDYVAQSGTLTFTPGQNQKLILVQLIPNNDQQPNRSFSVVLDNPVKATISDDTGVGTILDDDTPKVSISNFSRNEDALVPPFTFTVTLNHGVSHTVTMNYHTEDNTATVANNDYVPQSGSLTFNPKETTKTITITINPDSTKEGDVANPWETFRVRLTDLVGGTFAGTGVGTGTIQDDDSSPLIVVDDVTVAEEAGNATFSVRLLGASAVTQVTVKYQTQNGTATAPADYTSTNGTLTFAFKERQKFVTVPIKDDTDCEGDETFSLRLTNPHGATIADNTGVGTIDDTYDCFIVATELALFRAEPLSDGIAIRWQFTAGSEVSSARIERGDAAAGPWAEVVATPRDENGVSVMVDRTAAAGRSYWYRIVVREAGGENKVFGPIQATAIAAVNVFELSSVRPNPSTGPTRVDFAVARGANVRLSIVDVQSREVAVLASGWHPAGRYQVTWNGQTANGKAPVGLYFVRYQANGQVQQMKRLALTR